jgi:hypothetical protein
MKNLPERALIIRPEPLEKVFAGTKTWEIRNMSTNIRGTIGLIASRSGLVLGTCELVDVIGPLRYSEFRDNARKWGGRGSDVGRADHLQHYAWVLRNPRRFRTPIPYRHPSGAIIWVKLMAEALRTARTKSSRSRSSPATQTRSRS